MKTYLMFSPHVTKRLLLTLILGICFTCMKAKENTTLTIIGNKKGVPADLKESELRAAMKGEKQRWPDGTKILLALMKTTTPLGQNTATRIYHLSGDALNKYWLALVFQGKATAPTFFSSPQELETYVANTPGAIGVVSKQGGSDCKTVTINGKKDY